MNGLGRLGMWLLGRGEGLGLGRGLGLVAVMLEGLGLGLGLRLGLVAVLLEGLVLHDCLCHPCPPCLHDQGQGLAGLCCLEPTRAGNPRPHASS